MWIEEKMTGKERIGEVRNKTDTKGQWMGEKIDERGTERERERGRTKGVQQRRGEVGKLKWRIQ